MRPRTIVEPRNWRALGLSPPLEASTAPSIVKLLVISTNVMVATLMMLAELNGVCQSGVATRRYPYANSIAPNVTASEIMNNHIVSLRDGIE